MYGNVRGSTVLISFFLSWVIFIIYLCIILNINLDYFFIALKATNLAPFPLDWSLFCLTFRLIFLLKIQMQRSSDQNLENYFSTFVPIFFWWFLVISIIAEEFVLKRSSIFRRVILSPKEWFSFLPMWHFWEKFGQNWWWNAIKNAW